MGPDSIAVFEDWNCFVRFCSEAIEEGEWHECSEYLHSGHMAILVEGIPRLINGTIH